MEPSVSWITLLGYCSGLLLLAPSADGPHLLRTILLVNFLDSIMCRLFAHNNGYPKNLWSLLGFVFGLWAVAVLILLPRRNAQRA
jgi:hypothetical protein